MSAWLNLSRQQVPHLQPRPVVGCRSCGSTSPGHRCRKREAWVRVCRRSAPGTPSAHGSPHPPGCGENSASQAARRPSCSLWPLSHVARAKPGSPGGQEPWLKALGQPQGRRSPGLCPARAFPQVPDSVTCHREPVCHRLPGSGSQGGPGTSGRELARHGHSQAHPNHCVRPRSGARKRAALQVVLSLSKSFFLYRKRFLVHKYEMMSSVMCFSLSLNGCHGLLSSARGHLGWEDLVNEPMLAPSIQGLS